MSFIKKLLTEASADPQLLTHGLDGNPQGFIATNKTYFFFEHLKDELSIVKCGFEWYFFIFGPLWTISHVVLFEGRTNTEIKKGLFGILPIIILTIIILLTNKIVPNYIPIIIPIAYFLVQFYFAFNMHSWVMKSLLKKGAELTALINANNKEEAERIYLISSHVSLEVNNRNIDRKAKAVLQRAAEAYAKLWSRYGSHERIINSVDPKVLQIIQPYLDHMQNK